MQNDRNFPHLVLTVVHKNGLKLGKFPSYRIVVTGIAIFSLENEVNYKEIIPSILVNEKQFNLN